MCWCYWKTDDVIAFLWILYISISLLILVYFVGFPADILTVVGAVIVGYATCMLQQGFGSSFFSKSVCFA